ncbi:type III-B CRISPR module RAMP protein Cmr1 [Treponema sp. OMZ 788]|uniref:type III-B CRISPR module RAMP protein Cmr1 n=1 Tax=Treponema sp. OMZ 788 TaxID=2563664 RepID=UPI002112A21F|nr:type III-B CRISPR module RAMP protein Cmr1 [Treponema sp. OMZ 788]UTC65760.1 type III-B CRISPR module RAMP protein Cmr1 [Treponema sp. OMZ 788]
MLFLGGADGNAELRSASFKGLLRYWWRVLYGARYINAGEESLKAKEAEIFGTSGAKGSDFGQSQVHISIDNISIRIGQFDNKNGAKKTVFHNSKEMKINVLDYLAYGHHEYKKEKRMNEYIHTVIQANSSFNIKITALKKYSEEVFQAFLFMIEYGGVGSKSRNGFGSMKIIENKSNHKLNPALWHIHKNHVGFSALSSESRLYIEKNSTKKSWEEALSELAKVYMEIRERLDRKHIYNLRGCLARPIITRDRSVPDHVKKGRHPKCTLLSVSEKETGLYGKILILPVQFTKLYPDESNGSSEYRNMIKILYDTLDKNKLWQNNTASILGGQKNGR